MVVMRLSKSVFGCLRARKTQRVEEKLRARGATEARVPLPTRRSNVTLLVHSLTLAHVRAFHSLTPCPPFCRKPAPCDPSPEMTNVR